MAASILAGAFVVAQGFAVWGFLRFVKSFGAYTESQREFTKVLMEANQNTLMAMEALEREQRRTRDTAKERVA